VIVVRNLLGIYGIFTDEIKALLYQERLKTDGVLAGLAYIELDKKYLCSK
jgi:hypothetical protein